MASASFWRHYDATALPITNDLRVLQLPLEPYRTTNVSFAEMGVLQKVTVTEGMTVDEGQILAELSHEVQDATLQIARKSAESTGKLKSAQTELTYRKALHGKFTDLQRRNHATLDEVERAALDVALSEAALLTVQEELEVRDLECRRIELQIEECRLRSPLRGVVVQVFKEAGEFVAANDPVVMSVVQLDPLKVEFAIAPSVSSQLAIDQNVNLLVGDDKRKLIGTVDFVSPVISAESGTVRVRVSVPNSSGELRGGERCQLRIDAPSAKTPRITLQPGGTPPK